ncbi:MAG: multinuclear nonheme iron-dependent oxidase, partial [Usitatibacter sp.]
MPNGEAAQASVGIGLRAPHYAQILGRRPALAFLEVHSENFFAAGGQPLAWLERFRGEYALSLHGVGLSLGSADPLDERHLAKLESL